MAPKKAGKQNPRSQFFNAIRDEKLDPLRWCLRHGGITLRTEDDDGHTGIQIAAAAGKTAALEMLIEVMKKSGTQDDLEDTDEEGRTPLMMAAFNGKLECVLMLWRAKANLGAKDEKGKTAKDYAVSRKHDKLVAFFNHPKEPAPEPESEDDEEEKKARVFKASQKLVSGVNKQDEVHKAKVEAAEALERDLAAAPAPVWPEIEPVIRETRRELSLRGKKPLDGPRGCKPWCT